MDDRLYRSRTDRFISGVAGGLAEHLDIDPAIVRVVWVLLVLPTGFLALLAYVVMAVVVPEEPLMAAGTASTAMGGTPSTPPAEGSADTSAEAVPEATTGAAGAAPLDWRAQRRAERQAFRAAHHRGDGSGAMIFGAILVVVGSIFFVRQYVPAIDFDLFWPSALIALGVVLVLASLRRT